MKNEKGGFFPNFFVDIFFEVNSTPITASIFAPAPSYVRQKKIWQNEDFFLPGGLSAGRTCGPRYPAPRAEGVATSCGSIRFFTC
jgi:hypothetical protein